ncbi:hypothetical protein PVAP13_3NG192326 [Panicum virgatum]|uniref:Uncharacterized protein n=1 Tax=Panicum virgatum TaxID=38727 RepID=A0A8T0UFB4_PANVG|nr:hypothetical protein PVAP13_3NG192326 [Panicum virgatum]
MREQQPKKMTQADREIAVASRNQQPEAAFQQQAFTHLRSARSVQSTSLQCVRHPHASRLRAAGVFAPPGHGGQNRSTSGCTLSRLHLPHPPSYVFEHRCEPTNPKAQASSYSANNPYTRSPTCYSIF